MLTCDESVMNPRTIATYNKTPLNRSLSIAREFDEPIHLAHENTYSFFLLLLFYLCHTGGVSNPSPPSGSFVYFMNNMHDKAASLAREVIMITLILLFLSKSSYSIS